MTSSLAEPTATSARLRIDVPHWTALVSVIDNDLRLVDFGERISQVTGDPHLGRLELEVPPGPYEVEVSLDGKCQAQWVLAEANETVEVAADSWTELKINSALPQPAGAPALIADDKVARIASMTGPPRLSQTDVRLSLFGTAAGPCPDAAVRPVAPAREVGASGSMSAVEEPAPRDFEFDMVILDASGDQVVDLSSDTVRRYVAQRRLWRCFLDLPPGPYTLSARVPNARLGKEEIGRTRRRYQPIFLCPGLDHHLFFRCDGPPDLSMLSMHLTWQGQGYDPNRPEAAAADAVLAALANGQAQQLLVGSERLDQMLRGEVANPWLGVLAAYGLMSGPVDASLQAHIDDILIYLDGGPLAQHPDVQILLVERGGLQAPLEHPPMLLAAMHRLQCMAVERSGLIKPDSPLERLSGRLVTDTAWTAWILDDPEQGGSAPQADPDSSSLPRPIPAFVDAFPDSAPVFPLLAVGALPDGEAVRQNATLADHATIIEAASHALEEVCRTGANSLEVTVRGTEGSLLDMSPEQLSRLTGVPRDIVSKDLELLRTTQASTADLAEMERPLQLLAASVLSKQSHAAADQVDPGQPTVRPSPLETQARRLADEAARLRRAQHEGAPSLAAELGRLARSFDMFGESLIRRAHLVILADEQGRLRYGNRLLRDRLEMREEGAAAVLARMTQVLAGHPGDVLTVNAADLSPTSPEGRSGASVEIRRTSLMEDGKLIGFVYLLRDLTYPDLSLAQARRVDSLLPLISLAGSMLELPGAKAEHVKELQQIEAEISELLLTPAAV